MNIYPTIEALLHYAGAHLLFDELDYVYARNRILELMKLDDYEEYEINDDEVEAMQSCDELLDALCSYAVGQKVIAETEKDEFGKRLMACVLKRPSEIADLFSSLPHQKAFDFLADFGVMSGYIKTAQKRWDGKSTKGRIEVVMTGGDEGAAKPYPVCRLCRDNEGFKSAINMRSVPLELYGERMFFHFASHPLVSLQGRITGEYHRPLKIGKNALNKMFDFLNLMPNWVIAARDSGHENYTVSNKLMPLNKTPNLNRFKSAEYPYIDINTIDWYIGGVRLSCSNREKLIEYADKLISKWQGASDGNCAAVSVRKTDSQYIVEAILFNEHKQASAEISSLEPVTALMGVFEIGAKVEAALKQIEKFLTREEKFTSAKADGLAAHTEMITRLLAALGNNKVTELEASLDVKDEVNKMLENALIALNVPIDSLYGNF